MLLDLETGKPVAAEARALTGGGIVAASARRRRGLAPAARAAAPLRALRAPPRAASGPGPAEPVYCCGGCALAHRLTGGAEGHGQAAGLLMAVGVGAFLAMNVMMLSFVLYSGRAEADRATGEAWVRWALLLLATPALVLLGGPFLTRGFRRVRAFGSTPTRSSSSA